MTISTTAHDPDLSTLFPFCDSKIRSASKKPFIIACFGNSGNAGSLIIHICKLSRKKSAHALPP